MSGHGFRNPRLHLRISLAVTFLAWAIVAWGALEMHLAGEETLGASLKIGLALLPGILGPLAIANFWRGTQVVAAIRRGENAIGRWTVTAAELAEFSDQDAARNAPGGEALNIWAPPREPPSAGVETIFVPDGVLVGDTYFALVTTGLVTISSVRMLPGGLPTIAFRTITTWVHEHRVRTGFSALRIPVSRLAVAEGTKVVRHFERVESRKVIVNESFYRRRIRFGLITAPVGFAVAAAGFAMQRAGGFDDMPLLLIIIGVVLGTMMLLLALAATLLRRAQLRRS